MTAFTRRSFFLAWGAAAVALPATGRARARAVVARIDGGVPESFPTQAPEQVREIVLKAHTDYDAVNAMVSRRPELAKAGWDWGFGDWESALGAASHMGRRDIADVLVAHGARPNLFTFAMLGQLEAVRAICEANPGIQKIPGPHGITLLEHARQGQDAAAGVVEYLDRLGGADEKPADLELDPETGGAYAGEYVPEGADDVVFHVTWHERRQGLTFARDDRQIRFLLHRGEHEFSPGGAASVRITFDVRDGEARALTVLDGDLHLRATRR